MPEPPHTVQEQILLGALETMDQDYQQTALGLGVLFMPTALGFESDTMSDEDDIHLTAFSSDVEGSITGGM